MRSTERSLALAAAAACVALAACRGSCAKEVDEDLPPERPQMQPLFPTEGVKPNPLAQRFCTALHALPATRRAECCKEAPGIHFSAQCTSALSSALAQGSIAVDESEVARCEAAIAKLHEGCDWIGPTHTLLPPECARVVHGKLAAGAECKSSLECNAGLRCAGAGVSSGGKCAPPSADGYVCNLAVDALATFARQDDFELEHPQCNGYCERHHCATPFAIGAECKSNAQCGRGNRCSAGRCVAGAKAAAGEPCQGDDCAFGLRCNKHVCVEPKAIGEACTDVFDCKSDCVSGKCALGCGLLPPILRKPATSTAAR